MLVLDNIFPISSLAKDLMAIRSRRLASSGIFARVIRPQIAPEESMLARLVRSFKGHSEGQSQDWLDPRHSPRPQEGSDPSVNEIVEQERGAPDLMSDASERSLFTPLVYSKNKGMPRGSPFPRLICSKRDHNCNDLQQLLGKKKGLRPLDNGVTGMKRRETDPEQSLFVRLVRSKQSRPEIVPKDLQHNQFYPWLIQKRQKGFTLSTTDDVQQKQGIIYLMPPTIKESLFSRLVRSARGMPEVAPQDPNPTPNNLQQIIGQLKGVVPSKYGVAVTKRGVPYPMPIMSDYAAPQVAVEENILQGMCLTC